MRRTGDWVEVTQVGGVDGETTWINLARVVMMRRHADDDETLIWQQDDEPDPLLVRETPEAILAVPARMTERSAG